MGERELKKGEEEEEEGCVSSSSWAGEGAAPGSEHHLQPGICRVWGTQGRSQHWMVRREGRERCPCPPEGRGWFWLPGMQDGVPGRRAGWEALPEGFRAAQGCEGGVGEL